MLEESFESLVVKDNQMRHSMKTFARIVLAVGVLIPISGYGKINPDSLVGVWYFNEGKGDAVADASPNGYNGTITNAKWDEGQFDKAVDFAKGGTAAFPLDVGVVRDQISVVMWLKFTDLAGQQNYFSIWDSGDKRIVPFKTDGHELRFWTNNWNIGSGSIVTAKTWVHVANVFDGKTAYIYVNGAQKVAQGGVFELSDTQQTAWVATDKGTGFFSAVVADDVGLFNAALSAADVADIMKRGLGLVTGIEPVRATGKLARTWAGLKTAR